MHSYSALLLKIFWIAGAWAVLVIGATRWVGVDLHSRPLTPVDGTHSGYAHQWRFLNSARGVIPPGSSVTFVSYHPEVEMHLFMLALGVMTDCTPLPWTYWLGRQEAYSAQAEYVLSYLRDPPPDEKGVEIARFEGHGLVLKR